MKTTSWNRENEVYDGISLHSVHTLIIVGRDADFKHYLYVFMVT